MKMKYDLHDPQTKFPQLEGFSKVFYWLIFPFWSSEAKKANQHELLTSFEGDMGICGVGVLMSF